MAKFYKAPKGFRSTEEYGFDNIEEGMAVYLDPHYVREDESPRRYVVMNLGKTVLLADNKKMYNNGEGYFYSLYSVNWYKPF